MSEKSSLAIIVPCYNEVDSIPAFFNEMKDFISKISREIPDLNIKVVVVDNMSDDGSGLLLRKKSEEFNQLQITECSNRGYGAALKHGFQSIEAKYYAFLDLDNTYPLDCFIQMFREMQTKDCDIIYGARIHHKSDISLVRGFGNRFYVVLLRYLFSCSLTDVCSGMRLFRAEKKPQILNLESNDLSFSIDFTILSLSSGWKIAEIPIPYRDRTGESKLSVVKDGFLFLAAIIRNYVRK